MTNHDDDAGGSSLERTADKLDEFGGLLNAIPYAEQVLFAVRWARIRRIRAFLRGLNGSVSTLSEEKKRTFDHFVRSELGRELLADYADAAIRSRSETAVAALAILFGDADNERFAQAFRAAAARALDGVDERTVSAFLLIMENVKGLPRIPDETYPTIALRDSVLESSASLAQWSKDGPEWVVAVQDLVSRGLLLPDVQSGMRFGDESQTWCAYFVVGKGSEDYVRLLIEARALVGASDATA